MTTERIIAKRTLYNGIIFRSRLEARYAIFFDEVGIKYDYEKSFEMRYNIKYTPDFILHNVKWRGQDADHYIGKPGQPVFVEVKGVDRYQDISIDERTRIELFAEDHPLLILGVMPAEARTAPKDDDLLFSYYFMDRDMHGCFFTKHNGEIWIAGKGQPEFDEMLERELSIARQARFNDNEDLLCEEW